MSNKLKRVGLILSAVLLLGIPVFGQSHFVYFQSDKNIPFYLRINDSLKNSSAKGYLVLHDLSEGKQVVVVGLAGKRVPEAAFQLKFKGKENQGFLIKDNDGTLNLVEIKSKKAIEPVKTATAAGNRIRSLPGGNRQEGEKVAKAKNQKKEDSKKLSFGSMLNAVTGSGGSTDLPEEQSQKDLDENIKESDSEKRAKNKTEEDFSTLTEEVDQEQPERQSEEDTEVVAQQKKEQAGLFDQLLNKDNNKIDNEEKKDKQESETITETSPLPGEQEKSSPSETSSDLNFLDFDNLSTASQTKKEAASGRVDSVRKENLQATKSIKPQKKRRKRLTFNDLLAKIDTVTNDDSADQSIAKPLLNKNKKRTSSVSCTTVADDEFFKKVKRKIAAKSSADGMLRVASRYLSEDQCFTISQIKEISYLFASEEKRLQFLEKAYPHCTAQDQYKTLVKTLDSPYYQKQLEAFLD